VRNSSDVLSPIGVVLSCPVWQQHGTMRHLTFPDLELTMAAPVGNIHLSNRSQRWSWFPGQNGGLAKVDSGFDYAAKFSCRISIA
jgi:hypothetical protein